MAERMCPECGEMSDEFRGKTCIWCAAATDEETELTHPSRKPTPLREAPAEEAPYA